MHPRLGIRHDSVSFLLEMLSETKGKKLGTLRCKGLKPPVVRGHGAAFRYWLDAFGHSGPYSQTIETTEDGNQKVVPHGNPMNAPGNVEWYTQNFKGLTLKFISFQMYKIFLASLFLKRKFSHLRSTGIAVLKSSTFKL